MRFISASTSDRLLACSWWAQPSAEWSSRASAAAMKGTDEHAWCETRIEDTLAGRALPMPETSIRRHAADWIARTFKAGSLAVLTEAPFAIDLLSGLARYLSKGEHRDYAGAGAMPGEFVGTADVAVYDAAGDAVDVYDFFTGFDWTSKVAQQRSLCLMAARAFGVSLGRWHIIQLSDDACDEVAAGSLDEMEMAVVEHDLAGRMASIGQEAPAPGEHCGYCPAASCPAQAEVVAELVPAAALVKHRFTADITTVEQAQAILPLWKLAHAFLDRVEDSLKAIADSSGGIPTKPGYVWKKGERTCNRFDRGLAEGLLVQLGATAEQVAALTKPRVEPAGYKEVKAR